MDTQYQNILNAISSTDGELTVAERIENYNLYEQLNKKGIELADLIQKAEKGSEPDDDLFKMMESSVKGDPDVKECRQRLADVKSSILSRICAGYPEYREAVAAYRDAVKKAYRDM